MLKTDSIFDKYIQFNKPKKDPLPTVTLLHKLYIDLLNNKIKEGLDIYLLEVAKRYKEGKDWVNVNLTSYINERIKTTLHSAWNHGWGLGEIDAEKEVKDIYSRYISTSNESAAFISPIINPSSSFASFEQDKKSKKDHTLDELNKLDGLLKGRYSQDDVNGQYGRYYLQYRTENVANHLSREIKKNIALQISRYFTSSDLDYNPYDYQKPEDITKEGYRDVSAVGYKSKLSIQQLYKTLTKVYKKQPLDLTDKQETTEEKDAENVVYDHRVKSVIYTELTAAYNIGRLKTYINKGIRFVKWNVDYEHYARGVICNDCNNRSFFRSHKDLDPGVYSIEEALSNVNLIIPQHPYCLCYWTAHDLDPTVLATGITTENKLIEVGRSLVIEGLKNAIIQPVISPAFSDVPLDDKWVFGNGDVGMGAVAAGSIVTTLLLIMGGNRKTISQEGRAVIERMVNKINPTPVLDTVTDLVQDEEPVLPPKLDKLVNTHINNIPTLTPATTSTPALPPATTPTSSITPTTTPITTPPPSSTPSASRPLAISEGLEEAIEDVIAELEPIEGALPDLKPPERVEIPVSYIPDGAAKQKKIKLAFPEPVQLEIQKAEQVVHEVLSIGLELEPYIRNYIPEEHLTELYEELRKLDKIETDYRLYQSLDKTLSELNTRKTMLQLAIQNLNKQGRTTHQLQSELRRLNEEIRGLTAQKLGLGTLEDLKTNYELHKRNVESIRQNNKRYELVEDLKDRAIRSDLLTGADRIEAKKSIFTDLSKLIGQYEDLEFSGLLQIGMVAPDQAMINYQRQIFDIVDDHIRRTPGLQELLESDLYDETGKLIIYDDNGNYTPFARKIIKAYKLDRQKQISRELSRRVNGYREVIGELETVRNELVRDLQTQKIDISTRRVTKLTELRDRFRRAYNDDILGVKPSTRGQSELDKMSEELDKLARERVEDRVFRSEDRIKFLRIKVALDNIKTRLERSELYSLLHPINKQANNKIYSDYIETNADRFLLAKLPRTAQGQLDIDELRRGGEAYYSNYTDAEIRTLNSLLQDIDNINHIKRQYFAFLQRLNREQSKLGGLQLIYDADQLAFNRKIKNKTFVLGGSKIGYSEYKRQIKLVLNKLRGRQTLEQIIEQKNPPMYIVKFKEMLKMQKYRNKSKEELIQLLEQDLRTIEFCINQYLYLFE